MKNGRVQAMGGVQRKFELTGPQIAGSVLAAVTAAVAASYLGVAGTVIGAALVSGATTVGTAVYTHYLKRTGDKVKRHTAGAWRGHAGAQAAGGGSSCLTAVAGAVERAPRKRLPWAKVSVATGLVFAISMGGILTYQRVADRTVAEQLAGKPTRTQPQAGRGKHAKPGAPTHPMRATAIPSVGRSPSPVATATPTAPRTLAPAPIQTPTSTSTLPGEGASAPAPTGAADTSGSASTSGSSPGQSPSPAGAVLEVQYAESADPRHMPACHFAAGHASPAC